MMRNLKRLTSIILLFSLIFTLCSCGAKSDEKETNSALDTNSVPTEVYDYDDETIAEEGEEIPQDDGNETTVKSNEKTPTKPNKTPSSKPQINEPETLEEKPGREIVRVTIPEGYTLTQIFKKLEANGVCSFDSLMKTAQTYDYSYYPLIAQRPNKAYVFNLEGYLFPSTYEFYKNEKPQDAIGRFLRKGKTIFDSTDYAKAQSLGCSIHDILTIASIIEKEGSNPNEVRKIAGVIYNRLEKGMKLQMDSGIVYLNRIFNDKDRNVASYANGDVSKYSPLYNMYKCAGLPAGPISNPGLTTINAALNPDRSGDYLYFCHDDNANYYYAKTYEEHQANIQKAGIK